MKPTTFFISVFSVITLMAVMYLIINELEHAPVSKIVKVLIATILAVIFVLLVRKITIILL